jgi:hypothetical protein
MRASQAHCSAPLHHSVAGSALKIRARAVGLVVRDDPAVVVVLIFAAFLALFKNLTP